MALHPHSTVEGRYFPSHRTAEVAKGQSSDQVRAVLGEPFEVTDREGTVVWRYFEKFYPRACTTRLFGISLSSLKPESVETEVRIRDGFVEGVTERRIGARP